jgi:amide synthase
LSAETLRELHVAHLETIPYDGTETVSPRTAAGFDDAYERIVRGWHGGRCTDLNRLFAELLRRLGFTVRTLPADVARPAVLRGLDPVHTVIRVLIGTESWLLDVGFPGPSFLEPLRFVPGLVQEQYGCSYRVVGDDGGSGIAAGGTALGQVIQRKSLSRDWHTVYRIRTRATAHRQHRRPHPVYARLAGHGQLIVSGNQYLRVDDGYENVRRLETEDRESAINEILHSWLRPVS